MAVLAWGAWMIGGCSDSHNEVQEVQDVESVPVDPGLLSALQGAALDATLTPPTPTPSPVPDVPEPAAPAEAGEPDGMHLDSGNGREAVPPTDGGGDSVPTDVPIVAITTNVQDAFLAGYRAGGGDPAWEEHLVNDVIPCESGWNVDSPGIHYGLAQFAPGTWESAKCSPTADWRDPWEQGCAVASWMAQIPGQWGTTQGWPYCFNVWN